MLPVVSQPPCGHVLSFPRRLELQVQQGSGISVSSASAFDLSAPVTAANAVTTGQSFFKVMRDTVVMPVPDRAARLEARIVVAPKVLCVSCSLCSLHQFNTSGGSFSSSVGTPPRELRALSDMVCEFSHSTGLANQWASTSFITYTHDLLTNIRALNIRRRIYSVQKMISLCLSLSVALHGDMVRSCMFTVWYIACIPMLPWLQVTSPAGEDLLLTTGSGEEMLLSSISGLQAGGQAVSIDSTGDSEDGNIVLSAVS